MIYLDMDRRKEALALGGIALVGLAAYEGFKIAEASRHQDEQNHGKEVHEETIVDLESLSSGDSGFVAATGVNGQVVFNN